MATISITIAGMTITQAEAKKIAKNGSITAKDLAKLVAQRQLRQKGKSASGLSLRLTGTEDGSQRFAVTTGRGAFVQMVSSITISRDELAAFQGFAAFTHAA